MYTNNGQAIINIFLHKNEIKQPLEKKMNSNCNIKVMKKRSDQKCVMQPY
jgi:hypothetical protein